jgi:hypothetical protein
MRQARLCNLISGAHVFSRRLGIVDRPAHIRAYAAARLPRTSHGDSAGEAEANAEKEAGSAMRLLMGRGAQVVTVGLKGRAPKAGVSQLKQRRKGAPWGTLSARKPDSEVIADCGRKFLTPCAWAFAGKPLACGVL